MVGLLGCFGEVGIVVCIIGLHRFIGLFSFLFVVLVGRLVGFVGLVGIFVLLGLLI